MVPPLRSWICFCALLVLAASIPAVAADFFAAPQGRSLAAGSRADPWDIETALAQPAVLGPGDVIWLRGGVYSLSRPLVSRLSGAKGSPIMVRQFPGERATLDCRAITESEAGTDCLVLKSAHTWYWGFEIMNSTLVRRTSIAGSTADPRGLGILAQAGAGTKLINLVIHDVGTALFESQPWGIEIYGTIAYNSGWEAPDRSHGPGFYVRNRSGDPRKLIRDNIVFQHYRQGLQGYGTFPNVFSDFLIEGNVFFNNGIGPDGFHRNLMFGNDNTDHRDNIFRENYTYFSDGAGAGSNMLGSDAGGCHGLALLGNVFAHGPGRTAVDINHCTGVEIAGNLFFGSTTLRLPGDASEARGDAFRRQFPRNLYYGDDLGEPRGVAVFLRPNEYERGRAHVIVYNWELRPEVRIDLGGLAIHAGDRYEIRSVQDYFGAALHGVYRGEPVTVPMSGWHAAVPIGVPEAELPATFPEFGVFVLSWRGSDPGGEPHRRRAYRAPSR